MLRTRVLTALVMFAVFCGLNFYSSPKVWQFATTVLMAWAALEWGVLAKFSVKMRFCFAMLVPVIFTILLHLTVTKNNAYLMFGIVAASFLFWTFVVPLWLYKSWHAKNAFLLFLVGCLTIIPCGLSFVWLRPDVQHAWLLIGYLMIVFIADTSAFFTGRAFGKHKLAPSISPGKTIEGAMGAVVGVCLYLSLVFFFKTNQEFESLSWYKIVICGFVLTYFSILGDLFESWLKRCAGLKDSGTSLPGHGGILDRIDAVVAVTPFHLFVLGWLGLS